MCVCVIVTVTLPSTLAAVRSLDRMASRTSGVLLRWVVEANVHLGLGLNATQGRTDSCVQFPFGGSRNIEGRSTSAPSRGLRNFGASNFPLDEDSLEVNLLILGADWPLLEEQVPSGDVTC